MKWVNNLCVESENGFIVQCVDRFVWEYIEGNKKISIYTDAGRSGGKVCIIILPDAFKQWDDGTLILPDKQKEILENFREGIEFQNLKLKIYEGE